MGGEGLHDEPSQWSNGGMSSTLKYRAGISLPPTCGHKKEAKLLSSKSERNPGKKFWICPHCLIDDDCHFFQWVDESTCEQCKKLTRLNLGLLKSCRSLLFWVKVLIVLLIVTWIGVGFAILYVTEYV
ncbi:hypothetical protein L6164_021021 [Bauhinia variegata]|uniref:Uncharacterized protein n=1 Tax=Bauhinia variegata TaxID=167791 RepID=A0ACB9MXD4_BAUVA|nr:hypothetical protein L6164_021021 [Bauhinia variegata]